MHPYNNNSSRNRRATTTTTWRKRQLRRRRSSWRNKPCLSGSSRRFHTVHSHTSFPLLPKIVNMTNTSLVQHNLKHFSHIFRIQVASHIRSISMDGEGLPLAKRLNLGMSFSGNWFGPYTLLPRVVMTGNPYERLYAITSIFALALVAKLGFVGSSYDASWFPTIASASISP